MVGCHVEEEENDTHVIDGGEANGNDVQIYQDQYPYYLLQYNDLAIFYGR